MTYFDHVRCPACNAHLDPEELSSRSMNCPRCGHELSGKDIFGLAASFAEEETPQLTLEDLMRPDGGLGDPTRRAAPEPPPAPPVRRRGSPTAANAPVTPSVRRALPGPSAAPSSGTTHLVERPVPTEPGAPSAADLLRQMRKKR